MAPEGAPGMNAKKPTPANRLGLDYEQAAGDLGAPPIPIVDVHTHIAGERAPATYKKVRALYGVEKTYSMTPLRGVDGVRNILGDSVRFIAVPDWRAADPGHAMGEGYLDTIRSFHAEGARVVKLFAAPRMRELEEKTGGSGFAALDSKWRVKACELACELGMMFMTHVADPDTWFQGKYADAARYGTKAEQYGPLSRMLTRFPVPWIAAHMGGWPEDLEFLSGFLERFDNLYLDTSATKWMVRELSKHPRKELVAFLARWQGRVLFGSDIVTTDEHFGAAHSSRGMGGLADSEDAAFDLYASRYWALRTMWETGYDGASPIADPDLAMLEPDRYGPLDAPKLRGARAPERLLHSLYSNAAATLLGRYEA